MDTSPFASLIVFLNGGESAAISEAKAMKTLLLKLTAPNNTSGQDLIEYALMAGFVALTAAAILPDVASSISTIFSQVTAALPTDVPQVAAATS